jgi:hypothetical protein
VTKHEAESWAMLSLAADGSVVGHAGRGLKALCLAVGTLVYRDPYARLRVTKFGPNENWRDDLAFAIWQDDLAERIAGAILSPTPGARRGS